MSEGKTDQLFTGSARFRPPKPLGLPTRESIVRQVKRQKNIAQSRQLMDGVLGEKIDHPDISQGIGWYRFVFPVQGARRCGARFG